MRGSSAPAVSIPLTLILFPERAGEGRGSRYSGVTYAAVMPPSTVNVAPLT